jgi:hypothetical protein
MINWNNCSKEDVGPGWGYLIDILEYHLTNEPQIIDVVQIKEKFGTLRFYIDYEKEYPKIIDLIERLSEFICEQCAKPGTLDTNSYWYKTLCPECSAARALTRFK